MRNMFLKSMLLICEEISPTIKVLINKGANIMKDIFVVDYPQNWFDFNSDINQFLISNDNQQINKQKVLFYLKFFIEIHTAIGDRTIDKSPAMLKRDENLKDSLKTQYISDFITTILKIFEIFSTNTEIIFSALEVLSGYSYWIDINLFFNQQMMGFLFKFILVPYYAQVVFDCLGCMCEKGMPLDSKLTLINFIFTNLFELNIVSKDCIEIKPIYEPYVAKFVNIVGLVLCDKLKNEIKSENYSDHVKQALVCMNELMKLTISLLQKEINLSTSGEVGSDDCDDNDSFIIILANFILDYLVIYKKVYIFDSLFY